MNSPLGPWLLDLRDAWCGLRRRPMRSILSGLGIGIGVAALVAMMSISEGARREAMEKILSLGINKVRIESPRGSQSSRIANLSQGLDEGDRDAIAAWLGARGMVGAYLRQESVTLESAGRSVRAGLYGVDAQWLQAEGTGVAIGRGIAVEDVHHYDRVMVLGHGLVQELQTELLALVQAQGQSYTMVGSLRPKGTLLTEGTGLSALDFDRTAYLPLGAFPFSRQAGGRLLVDGLVISLADGQLPGIHELAEQIRQLLVSRHNGVEDFSLVLPLHLLEEAEQRQQLFALVMGTIASLSLLVGGIGVMNVMLANIAEQTREIGLRMALGATPHRIVSLFLWNSALLSVAGACWGVVVGIVLALAIQYWAGWQVVFSSLSLCVGPVSALVTGLLFGLHPAFRAAALDPALALRDS